MQYVCSLRTILKICAKYAQFAHIKRKEKSTAPVAGHPSKYWAGPMLLNFSDRTRTVLSMWYGLRHLSYSRRPFICAATLPKVSVLKIFFHL